MKNSNPVFWKINPGLSLFLVTLLFVISGCGHNQELKKDVTAFADAVCKYNGVMNKLKAAVEAEDSVAIAKLQLEENQCQTEMNLLNQNFQEKYKSRLSDTTFRKEYSKEIRKAILKCPNLSKEDRERFEKETD